MALFDLELPWDSQPQEAVGPSIEAIAAGLSSLNVFAGYERAAVGSQQLTRAGSGHVQSATALGQGVSNAGTGRWSVSNPTLTIAPPSSASFAVLLSLRLNATGQSEKYALYQRLAGSDQTAVIFGYVANTFELYSIGYTGSDPRSASAIVIADTAAHTLLYTYDGVAFQGWLDGRLVFSTAITFAITASVPTEASILDALGGNTLNATIITHATFSRGLSAEQAARFTRNVGEMFEPHPIPVYVAGAGGAPAESGGSSASVAVTAAGAGVGSEAASGGASAAETVTAAGAGTAIEQASGGAGSSVTVSAAGAGTAADGASGGSSASVAVTAAGAGIATEAASGGSSASVSVTAAGAGSGADGQSGGSSAIVTTSAAGAGTATEEASGGVGATVVVTAAGGSTEATDVISLGGSRNHRESPAAQAAMLDLAQQQEAEARDLREVHEIIAALFAFEGVF